MYTYLDTNVPFVIMLRILIMSLICITGKYALTSRNVNTVEIL
jgi:hypothetical protein